MFGKLLLATGAISLLPLCTAFALPVNSVDQLVVFGDSLSDSGNASIFKLGAQPGAGGYYKRSVPGVPFPVGEFTNAPTASGPTGIWVDQLAPKLGVSLPQPYLAGGSNYAVASASTGSNKLDGVTDQLGYFAAGHLAGAPSSALYTFWAGANDIGAGHNPVTAADNIYRNIITLAAAGAKDFLWLNLPDLGKTPAALAAGSLLAGEVTAASLAFDAEWAADINKLQNQGIYAVGVDVGSLFSQLEANPAALGFSNTTTAAMTVPGANPDKYLFFDSEHPTAAADALVADLAYRDLTAASTPEPAAIGLAVLGLAGLWFVRFRVRCRA